MAAFKYSPTDISLSTYRIAEYILKTSFGVFALLATDHDIDSVEMWAGPEQFLHQHFAHEASPSSDQHVGAPVELLHLSASVANAIHVCH